MLLLMLTWQSSHFAHVSDASRIPYFQFRWFICWYSFIPHTNRLFSLIVFLFTVFYIGEEWRKNSIVHSYYAVVCMTFKYISSFLYSYGFLGSNRIIPLFVRHLKRRQQITEWGRDSSRKLICRRIFSEIENRFYTFKRTPFDTLPAHR